MDSTDYGKARCNCTHSFAEDCCNYIVSAAEPPAYCESCEYWFWQVSPMEVAL